MTHDVKFPTINILHNDTHDLKFPTLNMFYRITPHAVAPGNCCKQLYQGSLWCNDIWILVPNVRPQNLDFVRWTLQLFQYALQWYPAYNAMVLQISYAVRHQWIVLSAIISVHVFQEWRTTLCNNRQRPLATKQLTVILVCTYIRFSCRQLYPDVFSKIFFAKS